MSGVIIKDSLISLGGDTTSTTFEDKKFTANAYNEIPKRLSLIIRETKFRSHPISGFLETMLGFGWVSIIIPLCLQLLLITKLLAYSVACNTCKAQTAHELVLTVFSGSQPTASVWQFCAFSAVQSQQGPSAELALAL